MRLLTLAMIPMLLGAVFVIASPIGNASSHMVTPVSTVFAAASSSSDSVWWVGAESTDSSALPNTGVEGAIQVISFQVTGCLSFWVADGLSNNNWGQVGYYICSGSTPVAFYQIWSLGSNTVLSGGSTSVSTGMHTFSMYLQSGTTWAYALDGGVFGTYDMGSSVSSSTYPVQSLSEEQGTSTFSIPAVTFITAMDVMKSGSWGPVQSATSYGTGWGVQGEAQNPALSADEIIVGGSIGALSQGTQLWSSSGTSTTTTSSTSLPPPTTTVTSTSTVTSTIDTTQTSTVTSTVTSTATTTATTTSTSVVPTTTTYTTTSTATSTKTSTVTSTATTTATTTSTSVVPTTTTYTATSTVTSTVTSTSGTSQGSTSTVTVTSTDTQTLTTTSTTTVTTGATSTTGYTTTVTSTATTTAPGGSTTTVTTTQTVTDTIPITATVTSQPTVTVTSTTTVTRATILTVAGPPTTTTVTRGGTTTVTSTSTRYVTESGSAMSSSTENQGLQSQNAGTSGSASPMPTFPLEVLLVGITVGVGGIIIVSRRAQLRSRRNARVSS